MPPIRHVIHDAPEFIPVPPEFQHRPIELIIWPLEEVSEVTEPTFLIAEVERIIMPSRDERNAYGKYPKRRITGP